MAVWAVPVQAAQTYGLVIGIDAYDRVIDLQGAVNDARDIADALKGLDAEVTLLLDQEASRAAILQSWQDILDKAAPGDTLIVTYAGHGSNEPEHTPGNEEDGLDENFLLSGYSPYGKAAGERIRDDEIADLIAQRPDLEVIIVADACHAGTVTRNLKPALGYRYVSPTRIENDPLPPPPPRPVGGDGQSDVALFLAAVSETQKVPEFLIDGTPRGALSYAFAQGLRGAADHNGDQLLTKGELETHVRRTVRIVSQGVQLPQAFPVGAVETPLIAMSRSAKTEPRPQDLSFENLPPLTLATDAPLPALATVIPAAPLSPADAHYDFGSGDVTSMVGDVIATVNGPAALAPVMAKMQVAKALSDIADTRLSITFAQGDRTYRAGNILTVDILNRSTQHLTLINIASTGEVAMLYPIASAGDPSSLPPQDTVHLPLQVAAPFGADHVVALESLDDPAQLRRQLSDLSGTSQIAGLWDLIRTQPDLNVAVFPFFTVGQE